MRTAKVIMLVMLVAGGALATRQVARRLKANSDKPVAVKLRAEVASAIQRHETGQYDLLDIAFLENGEAWAVGYDDQHTDRVYHSADIGKTWQPVDVPGTGFTLKAISFANAQNGWAVGGSGLVLRTTDGGKSWQQMKPPTRYDLTVVHFFDERVGFAGGTEGTIDRDNDEVTGSVEILCTRDGGETWRKCYADDQPIRVFQILARSESTAFAILGGNQLLWTSDQGETWKEVPFSGKYVTSIAFSPDGTGWLVGGRGNFQTSVDGGKTWRQPPSLRREFVNRDWWAVAFNNSGAGLAVGDSNTLAFTRDNGKTWELQTPIESDHLRAVYVQDSRAMILGAQKLYSVNILPVGGAE